MMSTRLQGLQVVPWLWQNQRVSFDSLAAQRQGGSNLKGSPRLTVFAVVPGAAHSVPHAAFPALSASQTDLYASDTGSPAAGTGAVLVSAALLILCARVGLREGSELVSNSSIPVPTPSRSPSASSKAL